MSVFDRLLYERDCACIKSKTTFLSVGKVSTLEVVVKEFAELVVLLGQVGDVDEEPAAHVALHRLDLVRPGWPVVLHQKITIYQEASSTDLFRTLRGD